MEESTSSSSLDSLEDISKDSSEDLFEEIEPLNLLNTTLNLQQEKPFGEPVALFSGACTKPDYISSVDDFQSKDMVVLTNASPRVVFENDSEGTSVSVTKTNTFRKNINHHKNKVFLIKGI